MITGFNAVGGSRKLALPILGIIEPNEPCPTRCLCHCRVSYISMLIYVAKACTFDLGIAAQYAEVSSVLRIAQKLRSFAKRSLSSSGLRLPSALAWPRTANTSDGGARYICRGAPFHA